MLEVPTEVMRPQSLPRTLQSLCLFALLAPLGCLTPPPRSVDDTNTTQAYTTQANTNAENSTTLAPVPIEKLTEIDAWAAVNAMTPGINIGNTLENTTTWETGWGQPVITKKLIQGIASAGFKTIRLPVAWDTYAVDGRIQPDKLRRVSEVVDWITGAGMFCVLNIHWDGGWIDSSFKERYPDTYATFSPTAEKKFRSYWQQIATYFRGKNERLIFEGLNEETKFENEGSPKQAYDTLTRVNQLFVDTVRGTGGNNEKRLLIVTGYGTDFTKTCDPLYKLPVDKLPHRLFISVHYYTPWPFCGMNEDADWGKMAHTWGSPADHAELDRLFSTMSDFCTRNDIPAFIGEFGATEKKESASRIKWMSAVMEAAASRRMVPVLWDTGHDFSRHAPYEPSKDLAEVLRRFETRAKREKD